MADPAPISASLRVFYTFPAHCETVFRAWTQAQEVVRSACLAGLDRDSASSGVAAPSTAGGAR